MALRLGAFGLTILALAVAACGSRGHPVTTSDQAIAAAQAALIGSPGAAGPFTVARKPDTWEVSVPTPGEAVTVYVSAKNGRTIVYTEDGRDVGLVKTPVPPRRD